jgi:hypothetical protein
VDYTVATLTFLVLEGEQGRFSPELGVKLTGRFQWPDEVGYGMTRRWLRGSGIHSKWGAIPFTILQAATKEG